MNRLIYHVKFRKGISKWEARRLDAFRASLLAPTKEEAVSAITKQVRNTVSQVVIHDKDGRIQEERTFPRSSDPRRHLG